MVQCLVKKILGESRSRSTSRAANALLQVKFKHDSHLLKAYTITNLYALDS